MYVRVYVAIFICMPVLCINISMHGNTKLALLEITDFNIYGKKITAMVSS